MNKSEFSNWWHCMKRISSLGPRQNSDGEVVWVRPLTWRQQLRAFIGVKEDGSQLVEMAVVFPLLCIILTGMACFGLALYSQQQLGFVTANAVQSLATGASINGTTDPCATVESSVTKSLPTWVAGNFTYTLTIYTSSTAYTTSGPTKGTGFSCTGQAANLNSTGAEFQPAILTVSYPYSWFPIFTWSKYGTNASQPTGSLSTTQSALIQ
jgi:Flp pilus assembly protein TadG